MHVEGPVHDTASRTPPDALGVETIDQDPLGVAAACGAELTAATHVAATRGTQKLREQSAACSHRPVAAPSHR